MTDIKEKISQEFEAAYGVSPAVIARAPGRLEILGNHTDYNEGFALSCAVDKSTYFAAGPSPDGLSRMKEACHDLEVEFDASSIGEAVPGEWQNYVLGVIVELQRRGFEIAPFQAALYSNLPISSGMSSSAALEVSAALALGKLNHIKLEPAEWARVGQASENNYVGANTGLLDQFSSIMGRANELVRTDFRTLEVETFAVPDNVAIVVADSGVKHDLTQEYNERRERCEEAAKSLGVPFLRDTDMASLEAAKDKLSVMAYRRALHVVGENERVFQAIDVLKAGDLAGLGALWLQSHESSRANFENSCDELDVLVSAGESLPGFYGARLSGGGFGGISIHLVEATEAESYRKRLATAFATRFDREPNTMICTIGQGAETYV